MQAALQERYGPPEVVRVADVERPVPKDDEVLVRVQAASVNRADLDGLGPKPGFVRLFLGMRAPRNHGWASMSPASWNRSARGNPVPPGDKVFADLFPSRRWRVRRVRLCAGEGIPADAGRHVVRGRGLAPALRHPRAPGPTASTRPKDQARRQGRVVGASGNVGPFAVQIAKSMGAEVTGVCSTQKVDFVRSLGADHVIDYKTVDYTKTGERYDWIVDTDSHNSLRSVRRALRPNGVYVSLGGSALPILAGVTIGPLMSLPSDKWSGMMLWWKPFHADDVATLEELIATGKLKPVIDRRYPLSQVVDALAGWTTATPPARSSSRRARDRERFPRGLSRPARPDARGASCPAGRAAGSLDGHARCRRRLAPTGRRRPPHQRRARGLDPPHEAHHRARHVAGIRSVRPLRPRRPRCRCDARRARRAVRDPALGEPRATRRAGLGHATSTGAACILPSAR